MTELSLTRRKFLKNAGGISAGIASSATVSCISEHEASRPNILFLLTDDQRSDTLSCMGNPLLKTPNIDSLAAGGALFPNAFVTTSICPSNRASVLSGQHMRTHNIRKFSDGFSPEAFQKTYPALMRNAGYRTGFIGKYGVGAADDGLQSPMRQFDYWRGMKGQGPYFQDIEGEKVHSTHIMANQAGEFLNGCSKDQPWCLSISFKAPHHPWNEFDPSLKELFTNQQVPLALSATRAAEKLQPDFIQDSIPGSRYWGWSDSYMEEWFRYYYRLVKGVDIAVGKIIENISELGFDKNTVIFFTSDNGYMLYEHGLLGKWLMYEESIRVPMIIYDPRIPEKLRGARYDNMVLSIDCAPTILAAAKLPSPSEMQGQNLMPLINGSHVPARKDWFYEHTYTEKYPRNIPKSQGVRNKQWKYIRYIDQDPNFEQLFNLESDPLEMTNLADNAKYVDILIQLRGRLEFWRKNLPSANRDPDE